MISWSSKGFDGVTRMCRRAQYELFRPLSFRLSVAQSRDHAKYGSCRMEFVWRYYNAIAGNDLVLCLAVQRWLRRLTWDADHILRFRPGDWRCDKWRGIKLILETYCHRLCLIAGAAEEFNSNNDAYVNGMQIYACVCRSQSAATADDNEFHFMRKFWVNYFWGAERTSVADCSRCRRCELRLHLRTPSFRPSQTFLIHFAPEINWS